MHPLLRNILAVVLGIVVCFFLNGFLLGVLMQWIGTPEGFDPQDLATYGRLQGIHYLSPFLAHAVPSLVGGAIAAGVAATRKTAMAMIVGGLHLVGGIMAAFMIPAPVWFVVADLTLAYLPMAWLGARAVQR